MRVEQFLEHSADRAPEKIALVTDGGSYTYGELDRLSDRLAQVLLAEGVGRGDRVAIFLENSAEAVIGAFAILKVGAVFLVVNPGMKTGKVAYILNDCRATAVISHSKQREILDAIEGLTTSLRFLIVDQGEPAPWVGRRIRTLS